MKREIDNGLKKRVLKILIISVCAIAAATAIYFTAVAIYKAGLERNYPGSVVNYSENTVCGRFRVPEGFVRDTYEAGSFEYEIQHLQLKKFGLAAYRSDGKRLAGAPMWGVLLYDENTSAKLDRYGLGPEGSGPDASKTGAEVAPENVRAGCVCGVIDSENGVKILTGIVLDVCRDSAGNVMTVIGVTEEDADVYVAGAGGGRRTAWLLIGTGDFSFGLKPGSAAVFYEYDPE